MHSRGCLSSQQLSASTAASCCPARAAATHLPIKTPASHLHDVAEVKLLLNSLGLGPRIARRRAALAGSRERRQLLQRRGADLSGQQAVQPVLDRVLRSQSE